MPADLHGNGLVDPAGLHHVSDGAAPEIVKHQAGNVRRLTGVRPGIAELYDPLAAAVEPELNTTFFGSNPFIVKRDAIESMMTWLFTVLTLLGLLLQVFVAVWDDRIEERVRSTPF